MLAPKYTLKKNFTRNTLGQFSQDSRSLTNLEARVFGLIKQHHCSKRAELLDHDVDRGVKYRMPSRCCKSRRQNTGTGMEYMLIFLACSSSFWFGSVHGCLKIIVWSHGTMNQSCRESKKPLLNYSYLYRIFFSKCYKYMQFWRVRFKYICGKILEIYLQYPVHIAY